MSRVTRCDCRFLTDGRLAFSEPNKLTIYSQETLPAYGPIVQEDVTRQKIIYHRDSAYYFSGFSPDGRTLRTANLVRGLVQVWDAVPESLPVNGPLVSIASSDGRFVVELPEMRFGSPPPAINDLILKDAKTGKELGRIATDPQGMSMPHFVADSRRLLVNARVSPKGGSPFVGGSGTTKQSWTLYDTNGLHQIASGESLGSFFGVGLDVSRAGRWLIEGVGKEELVLRDPMTGKVTCRVAAPVGGLVVAIAFNPTEDRMFVITSAGQADSTPNAKSLPGALGVRMCNPATGETLWNRAELDNCVSEIYRGDAFFMNGKPIGVLWSNDARRVFVQYQGSPTESRVWSWAKCGRRTRTNPHGTGEGPGQRIWTDGHF